MCQQTGPEKTSPGFTIVEIIVVMVILSVLAAGVILSLTGWINKARTAHAIEECRASVQASQVIYDEAYGRGERLTDESIMSHIPEITNLAEVPGVISNVLLSQEGSIHILEYSSAFGVSIDYIDGVFGLAKDINSLFASVWEYSNSYTYQGDRNKEFLTIDYSKQNPIELTRSQKDSVFGSRQLEHRTQYLYPMAIFNDNSELLNIQYVTSQNPSKSSGGNRYLATAFIIDEKVYVSTARSRTGNVIPRINGEDNTFQRAMNDMTFNSTNDFVAFITKNNYYELAE